MRGEGDGAASADAIPGRAAAAAKVVQDHQWRGANKTENIAHGRPKVRSSPT